MVGTGVVAGRNSAADDAQIDAQAVFIANNSKSVDLSIVGVWAFKILKGEHPTHPPRGVGPMGRRLLEF